MRWGNVNVNIRTEAQISLSSKYNKYERRIGEMRRATGRRIDDFFVD